MIFLNLAIVVPAVAPAVVPSVLPVPRPVRAAALACAFILLAHALGARAEARCPQPRLLEIAPAVFAIQGSGDPEPTQSNCGRNVNGGAIVAPGGPIAIDPGPSQAAGAQLRAALRARGGREVAALINTHPHPESVLGNSAWSGARLPVLASDVTTALMAERCRRCVRNLRRSIGVEAMRGTRILIPNRPIAATGETVLAGRRLRLLRFEQAHAPGDLAVLDLESGVLFAGGLVNAGVIPDLHEAKLEGWLAALDELERQGAARIVPGHGDARRGDGVEETRAYLRALRAVVQRELASGVDLPSALPRLDLPQFRHLAGYAYRHPLNAQHAWVELERAAFDR